MSQNENRRRDYHSMYPNETISPEVLAVLKEEDRIHRYYTRDLKQSSTITKDGKKITRPRREVSLEFLADSGCRFALEEKDVEDMVINILLKERLHKALLQLSESEKLLIHKIYYEEKSERETAKSFGIPSMTLHCRKVKVLEKLKKLLEMEK